MSVLNLPILKQYSNDIPSADISYKASTTKTYTG